MAKHNCGEGKIHIKSFCRRKPGSKSPKPPKVKKAKKVKSVRKRGTSARKSNKKTAAPTKFFTFGRDL
jgi:hypothetical protein